MHQSSLEKMQAFRRDYLSCLEQVPLRIVDLGSMDVNGSYRPFFDSARWEYVGVDLAPGNNVDVVLRDPYVWREFNSASVDVVVSGQAFEHIEFFWLTMLEIARVLKPGGLCCLLAPSSGPEHRYPVDCWRFYPDGMRALARFSGLEVLAAETQWVTPEYPDCSANWKDSLLIVKKPQWGYLEKMRRTLAAWNLRLFAVHQRRS